MRKRGQWIDLLLMLLTVALLTAWLATRPPRPNPLVGNWQTEFGRVTFRADGSLELNYNKPKYGGRAGAYRVEPNKVPAELDVRLEDEVFFCIFEITPQGATCGSRRETLTRPNVPANSARVHWFSTANHEAPPIATPVRTRI